MTNTPIEDTFDNRKEYNYISSLFNDLEKIKVAEIQYKQHQLHHSRHNYSCK